MADKKEISNTRTVPAACDIYQETDAVICQMEMPGVAKDGLDIKVDGDKMFISGKKELKQPEGDYRLREIRHGNYYHEFTIDDTIDKNKIDASIKNGVVTIKLAMKESEKPRKINVVAQ